MFRSLLWKELRGAWVFGLAALLVQAGIAWDALRHADRDPVRAFSRDDTQVAASLLAFGLAVAMALWQTLPEMVVGTAPFLVQTARSRPQIVAAKILAGAAYFLAVVVLPLAVTLAVTLRKTESYYDWSDSRLLWFFVAAAFATYLGVLAVFLRGYPWREAPRQIAGAGLILMGILGSLLPSDFGIALGILGATSLYAAAWGMSGFASRGY